MARTHAFFVVKNDICEQKTKNQVFTAGGQIGGPEPHCFALIWSDVVGIFWNNLVGSENVNF